MMTIETAKKEVEIKDTIYSKFVEKFDNILPKTNNYFICGGVFPRLYHNLEIRDIDIFAINKKDFKKLLQFYDSLGFNRTKDEPYLVKYEIPNEDFGIDVVNNLSNIRRDKLEFVSKFDFSISRIYMFYDTFFKKFIIGSPSSSDYLDIDSKKLRFTGKVLFGSPENNTITRLLKYAQLGFQIDEEDYKSIGKEIFNLMKEAVLQEAIEPNQIGADTYDFKLRNTNNNTELEEVNDNYRLTTF